MVRGGAVGGQGGGKGAVRGGVRGGGGGGRRMVGGWEGVGRVILGKGVAEEGCAWYRGALA